MSELQERAKELKSIYEKHFGFEEETLFPAIETKIDEKILSYIQKTHGRIYDYLKKLESGLEKEYDPIEAIRKASELQGVHTTHIELENEYVYPILNEISSDEEEEIIESFEKSSFEGYVPLSKRDKNSK